MDYKINNKVALVSGGTQGIGFASAQALLNEGAKVAIFSRSQENVDSAIEKLDSDKNNVLGLVCDLGDSDSVDEMLKTVRDKIGQIDIFVGSSGGPAFGKAGEVTKADIIPALESNFVSLATLTNKLLPAMKENKWGRIVYVTTSGVLEPVPNLVLSNVSRSALTSYTKTLANEVASDGVTVNTVIPGRIATGRLEQVLRDSAKTQGITYETLVEKNWENIPAGRFGEPEEMANVITFLCSSASSYVTGSKIAVDGGMIKGE